jgi:hypothetical protein
VHIVVRYEPARYASISTTTRATLMLPASHFPLFYRTMGNSLILFTVHETATARSCSVIL